MKKLVLLCLFLMVSVSAQAQTEDPFDALVKQQPKDIADFLNRYSLCQHWSGEDMTEADREQEKTKAMKDLNCDALENDEKNLRARYANNPDALKAIDDGINLLSSD